MMTSMCSVGVYNPLNIVASKALSPSISALKIEYNAPYFCTNLYVYY